MLEEIVFSFCPYEVVMTDGGAVTPSNNVVVSNNAVRKLLFPLERKVIGTPVATPTVYSMSRSASVLVQHCQLKINEPSRMHGIPSIRSSLGVSSAVLLFERKGRRRADVSAELL
jgi:hypothetical protein